MTRTGNSRPRRALFHRAAAMRAKQASLFAALPANVRGALWILLAAVLFSMMVALVKFLGGRFDSMQVAFFRALTGLFFVVPLLVREGGAGFRTRRPWLHTARGFAGATAMLCGFYALVHLPLADATAITFARALFLVPLAILLLRERVGVRRISATAVGFIGVLIMLNPTGELNSAALIAALGAALVALALTFVKLLSRTESTLTLLFYSGMFGVLFTAIPAANVWIMPGWGDLALLLAMGTVGVAAHACMIRGYSTAEATALAPFDYTRLIFAGLIGYLVFADLPTWRTVLGAGIIVAATLYITYREARVKPRAARAPERPHAEG
ncbi:MAG: DMT family transporter [Alphaproteobacteria bacterium]